MFYHTEHPRISKVKLKRRIAIWAPGGGYVFCAAHNIQNDVPPENVISLYRACEKHGNYPLSDETAELRKTVQIK